MKVALVHDWLVSYRGGEKVLEIMSELYPEAPIYTLFYDAGALPQNWQNKDIRYPKKLNRWRRFRKLLLPWLPAMVESFSLFDYDLILSSSSCVAKGALGGPTTKHICYIHSPMRYIWDQRHEYFQGLAWLPFAETAIHLAAKALRVWDVVSAQRVDRFIANSSFVSKRVQRYFGRESVVIHPPIDVAFFRPQGPQVEKKEYFLVAGAFVAYKRFDLAIQACESLGKKLIVAGSGPYEKQLRALGGPHTEFVIAPDDRRWRTLLQEARALLFPGVEDFGMIAVEAMAAGTPVLAFGEGGARDFIVPGVSGDYISSQSVEGVRAAVASFVPQRYQLQGLLEQAEKFNKEHFLAKLKAEITTMIGEEHP